MKTVEVSPLALGEVEKSNLFSKYSLLKRFLLCPQQEGPGQVSG